VKLSKNSEAPLVDATDYRRVIGSLRYLVNTQPDLAFAMGYLSRFMESPHQDHQDAVKQVLRYIAGTCSHGLFYTKHERGQAGLVGYSDADMAGDLDGRKSTSGVIFFLGGNVITWQSSKQRVIRSVLMQGGVHCRGHSSMPGNLVDSAGSRHGRSRASSTGPQGGQSSHHCSQQKPRLP
jgi:hypothetical protein